jgi:hypothetical protein
LIDNVTWIKIERPVFDFVTFLLTSFALIALLVAIALVLGSLFGLGLILRGRRWREERLEEEISLRLDIP